jgi:hypothetical protein
MQRPTHFRFWENVSAKRREWMMRCFLDKQRSSPLDGGLESIEWSDSLWWGFGICYTCKLNDNQAFAALLATTLQDCASIGRCHALAESAFAGTFQLRRIICTFHR